MQKLAQGDDKFELARSHDPLCHGDYGHGHQVHGQFRRRAQEAWCLKAVSNETMKLQSRIMSEDTKPKIVQLCVFSILRHKSAKGHAPYGELEYKVCILFAGNKIHIAFGMAPYKTFPDLSFAFVGMPSIRAVLAVFGLKGWKTKAGKTARAFKFYKTIQRRSTGWQPDTNHVHHPVHIPRMNPMIIH